VRVHVALTPRERPEADVAIAVDVLRATSVVCQALAAGYEEVVCVAEVDEAFALRADGVGLAGERACLAVPGFDFGNSPAELSERNVRFSRLVLTTTNGTRLLHAAAPSYEVVLGGSLLNLGAVAAAARASGADRIAVLCAGIEGEVALDDVYCAGRIAASLDGTPSDGAVAAIRVAAAFASPLAALGASRSALNLRDAGLAVDVEWCARESVLDVVPQVESAAAAGPPRVIVPDSGSPSSRPS